MGGRGMRRTLTRGFQGMGSKDHRNSNDLNNGTSIFKYFCCFHHTLYMTQDLGRGR